MLCHFPASFECFGYDKEIYPCWQNKNVANLLLNGELLVKILLGLPSYDGNGFMHLACSSALDFFLCFHFIGMVFHFLAYSVMEELCYTDLSAAF